MQVEPSEIPFTGALEVLRVASRRIRSNSWHAREMVSGPEHAADGRFSAAC
jgi:hypothetical protein